MPSVIEAAIQGLRTAGDASFLPVGTVGFKDAVGKVL
jgi:hypothetical protein